MQTLIAYFAKRHLLTNVAFFGTLILAIFAWKLIGKEEMPEFTANWIRVSTFYPGASAEDVELFVTRPIEDELKGVVGLEDVISTSSVGVSTFNIIIDEDYPSIQQVVQDIKDAVMRVNLPSEVRDLPNIRHFKSSEKAIMDIGLYHKNHRTLDASSRAELQEYVLALESQLLSLPEISSIDRSHYLKPEIQVLVDPKKVDKQDFSLASIMKQIRSSHVRAPIGSLYDRGESKVSAINEYEEVSQFEKLILRGNSSGVQVPLSDFATIRDGFQRTNTIFKINGHEAVFLNIKKTISTDILSAQKAVVKFFDRYQASRDDWPIAFVMMDDESFDVRNRLSIIQSNGLIGFILIILVLFLFMDIKTGIWVAIGIPFTMAFTLIAASIFGYTVNNMTLAGIIIVLGIVVDDAIIIAENIVRHLAINKNKFQAAIDGAQEVAKPIIGSIATTCVAFIPLIYFEGFFGKLVSYIPLIVCLMLVASLLESLLILPAHMISPIPFVKERLKPARQWFNKYQVWYEKFLMRAFPFRILIILGFLTVLVSAFYLFQKKMNFVMFPNEETQEIVMRVKTGELKTRQDTSDILYPLEIYLAQDQKNVVGVATTIGLSRRGGDVKENEASILIELHPADQRVRSLDQLIMDWQKYAQKTAGIEEVKIIRNRWGWDSGSAIDLEIQDNNDQRRSAVSELIASKLKQYEFIADVEVDQPIIKKEYIFQIKQDQLIKYSVTTEEVTTVLRSFVEGSIMYSLNKGDEEVDVRLSVPDDEKLNLDQLLKMRVENQQGYLVDLQNLIELKEIDKPMNIKRSNFKRSSQLYADIKTEAKITPLQVAELMEKEIFPIVNKQYPSTIVRFRGEVEDSRESQGEFIQSIYIVLLLIFFILVIIFNSLIKPMLVLLIVPFGVAGVILVLLAHGKTVYGFFAVIGALGMIGVVVNDAIVMIDRIQRTLAENESSLEQLAHSAATRLRPIILTTLTTVVGILPTAYGVAGFDSMLAEMMLTMGWGLAFGCVITLILIPMIYSFMLKNSYKN